LIVYPVGSQVNKKTPTSEGYESAATISILGSLGRRQKTYIVWNVTPVTLLFLLWGFFL
jgi:hypothetical protein